MEDQEYREYRFQATLNGAAELHCAAAIRCHRWDSSSLDIELTWLGDEPTRRKAAALLTQLPVNQLTLVPVSQNHPEVRIFGIVGVGSDLDKAKVFAGAIEVGFKEAATPAIEKYTVFVRLQPSGILSAGGMVEQHFTGDVKHTRYSEDEIEFQTPYGAFKAMENFEYRKTESHGNEVTEQIRRATLIGEIEVPAGESLLNAHEQLLPLLDEACNALSLSYRQPVRYYEVEYLSTDAHFGRRAVFRNKFNSNRKRRKGEELIDARNLSKGGLEKLIRAIRDDPHSDSIARAINFLSASHEGVLEVGYFMAFSAMETVVDACLKESEVMLLTASTWQKFESTMRKCVAEGGASLEIEGGVLDEIAKKLPELKRSSLRARIAAVCTRYGPKADDLWPKVGFEAGMKSAAQARNLLFHAASSAGSPLHSDLTRIQAFTERLLLARLGWPVESLWVWNDEGLKWANMN